MDVETYADGSLLKWNILKLLVIIELTGRVSFAHNKVIWGWKFLKYVVYNIVYR